MMEYLENEKCLDKLDCNILNELSKNGRLNWQELAKICYVSAPTIRDRVHRLSDLGIIQNFTVEIDRQKIGYFLEAIVRFKPLPGKQHIVEQEILRTERIIQCDKITGDDGFIARLLLRNINELDKILDSFSNKATTNTSIVKTSPIKSRFPPLK